MAIQGRTRGVVEELDPGRDGAVSVHETFTCAHCNGITIVPHRTAWTDVGGMCWSCSKPICARNGCAKRYVDSGHKCENFERRLDEMEAREALRKAVG